ncbi:MAG: hypothetical protein AB8F94_04445 [Saprospiraceae bacterium]
MSIFLAWHSTGIFMGLEFVEDPSWILQLVFALIFNLFITGIFFFFLFALPTEKLMPSKHYKIKDPKKVNFWFKKLKGEWFRKFLLATVWRKKTAQKKFFDGTISGINNFEVQTHKSEFGHLIPLVIISVLCVYFVIRGFWWAIFFTMLINVIFNFYPILLQRHHRGRLVRMKKILIQKQKK